MSWHFFLHIPPKIANQFLFMSRETRATVLEQSLRKLGVEKLGKEDVQRMQWEVLEAKIGNWIHFMRISVRICIELYELLRVHIPTFLCNSNRSNCFLPGKRKSVIKSSKVSIHSKSNVLQTLQRPVLLFSLVLERLLPKARGRLKSYSFF